MSEKAFKLWNNIWGWSIFIIALFVFGSTVEPTSSFWDASEYISTSTKLQVGHPPGAPFFQMVGAFFAVFATSPEKIALMVNFMSVISSAFAILFLFWSTTILLRNLPAFSKLDHISTRISYWGSATVGSLAFCFSDSFWFNAVEAEVYAMAMLFLAILFWLALRWEKDMSNPKGNKWLVLMSLVMGLSFGVHFMALLAIPTIGMVYYFKNYPKTTTKGFLLANAISIAILLFIFKLLLPNTLAFFGKTEVFFVNSLRLPFNSGTIFAGLLIALLFALVLKYTAKKNLVQLNTIFLCLLFLLVGFSCWIMIPIRANANTVINQNNPSDARTLLAYYRMEQYPDTYLFYGPMFSDMYAGQDPYKPYRDDKPKYEKDLESKSYVVVNHWKGARLNSHSNHKGLLPRLWSTQNAANYMDFIGPLDFSILPEYSKSQQLQNIVGDFRLRGQQGFLTGEDYHDFFRSYGEYLKIKKPSLLQNLAFLVDFQMGYMYWRYFMWNFTGRQNDIQGDYSILNGNWISGIPFIDKIRLGNQSSLDQDALNNKARNTYYFLPLILGILGFLFLYNQDRKTFWKLLLLFLFTGLALKIYLNERPFEPRERDYALVGSFFVFSIGISLGSYYLTALWNRFKPHLMRPLMVLIALLCVPLLMVAENWDDHDRSNRYTAQSMSKTYLKSLQEDAGAIIFTIGDNDTFALWYAQEVEGIRTDVRTINTSLLATDWYIDQMKRKTYESEPIPSQLTHKQYGYGIRDYVRFQPINDSIRWEIKDFVNWVASDHPKTKYRHILEENGRDYTVLPKSQQEMIYYPTNKIRIPVNKENVLKYGIVKPEDESKIVPYIDIDLPTSGLTKNQIMMLDIIANNDWKRPIYFTGGSFEESEYIWMKDYLELEGMVYKLIPIETLVNSRNPYLMGKIDSEKMYSIVMQWEWGNSQETNIYHDPETRKNSITYRSHIARLAEKLIEEEKFDKAERVIDLALEKMPLDYFGYYSLLHPFIDFYYEIGNPQKARSLFDKVSQKYSDRLAYFSSLSISRQNFIATEILTEVQRYQTCLDALLYSSDTDRFENAIDVYLESATPLSHLYGDFEFYTPLVGFVDAYYKAGATEKAQKLASQIADQFASRANVYTQIPEESLQLYQNQLADVISRYSNLVKSVKSSDTNTSFQTKITEKFNQTVDLFDIDPEDL